MQEEQQRQQFQNYLSTLQGGGSPQVFMTPSGTPIIGGQVTPPASVSAPVQPINTTGIPPVGLSPMFGTEAKKYLGQTPESKITQDIYSTSEKEKVKAMVGMDKDISKSKLSNKYNLKLISGNMYDLSNWLVKAYKEGGGGNRLKSMTAGIAREGLLPEKIAERYANSAANYGKRFEIIGKMFPMLTQQLGKAGSVRLIQSVFEKISRTLPDLYTAPKLAVKEMEASVESMYRISRALEQINLSKYNLKNKNQQKMFIKDMADLTNQIEITGEEKKVLNGLKAKATEPIRQYVQQRDSKDDTAILKRLKLDPNRYEIVR